MCWRAAYGLSKSSSDLIGLRQVRIGPEHVGHSLAVFTAIAAVRRLR